MCGKCPTMWGVQEAEEALQMHQQSSGPSGPAVRLSATRLVIATKVGTTASAALTVRAVGTAAFRYFWTRSVQRPSVAVPDTENGSAQKLASDGTSEQSGFYLCDAEGSIMPGEERTFEFMWKPTQQGMATEAWQLHTSPQCMPDFEPTPVRFSCGSSSFQCQGTFICTCIIQLRCTGGTARRRCEARQR